MGNKCFEDDEVNVDGDTNVSIFYLFRYVCFSKLVAIAVEPSLYR